MIIRKICLSLSPDMKRILYMVSVLVLLCGCKTHKLVSRPVPSAVYDQERSRHVLIIMCDPAVGNGPLLEAARKMNGKIFRQHDIIESVAFRVPNNVPMERAIRKLLNVKGVQGVERDGVMHLD